MRKPGGKVNVPRECPRCHAKLVVYDIYCYLCLACGWEIDNPEATHGERAHPPHLASVDFTRPVRMGTTKE
jgi:hypothetical protein